MSNISKSLWALLALPTALLLTACPPPQPVTPDAGPVSERSSSSAERKEIALTVYNQSFGLVREVRELKDLGTGRVELEFSDVAEQLQPETVHIKSLAGPSALAVLEQNYRYDLLSPATLLDKYVGKKVKIYRYNEKLGTEDELSAEVLAVNDGQPVLKINGEVTYGYNGRFAFPEVPANLIPEPTLVWLLQSKQASQSVEISYLTGGLNWSADYVLVINADDTKGDLTGWVTLSNQSGTSYDNAQLKLVAGDVQRVAPDVTLVRTALGAAEEAEEDNDFREEGFFEYHLYTLPRPTSVKDKEQKQITLLQAPDAGVRKHLIFYGAQHYYRGRYGQVVSNQKVGVYLDLVNSKENGLGMALPKGVVRVYKADSSNAKQFIGEDRIDHTPRDEEIRIKMGEAFDIVGDRKQTDFSSLSRCSHETAWEVELRNHKDKAETVELYEPIGGDWKILESSHPHNKKDAHTFTFEVTVPANGKVKVTYRVRVSWC